MTTTPSQRLNDVDLAVVGGLVQHISEDPSAAATTWRAEVRWSGGFRSVARVRDLPPVASDEPPALGGTNTAPNPVEQVLGALGNCLAVGYAANASAAGIAMHDLRIELEGDIDLRASALHPTTSLAGGSGSSPRRRNRISSAPATLLEGDEAPYRTPRG